MYGDGLHVGRAQSVPLVEVAVGILWADDKVWIQRRRTRNSLENFWEFPGGKLEERETPLAALRRELEEEVGVRPRRPELLLVQDYSYPEGEVRIHFFLCRFGAQPKLEQGRWVAPTQLSSYRLPPANDRVVKRIQRLSDSRGQVGEQ